jgi:hypothetical protein
MYAARFLMLRGVTCKASATIGTAVFRIVVSRFSIKNATATSQGRSCLAEAEGGCDGAPMGRIPRLVILVF